MARKTKRKAVKAARRAAPRSRQVASTSTAKLTSQADLERLMTQVENLQGKVSTASGSIGEIIREYADKKNLHRPAFAAVRKLYRMGKTDPGKLWLMLAYFDDYREKLGIDNMAQEQSQMLPSGVDDEPESEGNITRMVPREVTESPGEAAE